jgi:transcriptional regulator
MDDEGHLLEISRKLDVIIRLTAIDVIRGLKLQKDQIAILFDSGFKPKEIAEILKTTPNNVSVTLTQIRKERNKGDKSNENGSNTERSVAQGEPNEDKKEK